MAIYKYLSAQNTSRYLQSWGLRLSGRNDLNDPFEFCIGRPEISAENVATVIASFKDRFPDVPQDARELHRAHFAERIANDLWPNLGVVCFSRTKRHLLMWGHYTDNHQGALLEFDDHWPCFHRDVLSEAAGRWEVSYSGLWGKLANVLYADEMAVLPGPPSADRLSDVCLTKSLDWAYEQEVRLFWPLRLADDVQGSGIHLYSVPSSALKSITFGCSSSPEFLDEARELLRAVGCTHVQLSRATPNPNNFSVDYFAM